MATETKFLTVADLAERYGVPEATIYKWRTHGTAPPGLRVGRHLRFRQKDVEAWEEDRVSEGTGLTSSGEAIR